MTNNNKNNLLHELDLIPLELKPDKSKQCLKALNEDGLLQASQILASAGDGNGTEISMIDIGILADKSGSNVRFRGLLIHRDQLSSASGRICVYEFYGNRFQAIGLSFL
jgi:hypothetical protein